MAVERYSSKTDAVVKLVLVCFVCLLSFSIGTFVGKKFSDNQHRLAKFEPGNVDSETRGIASVGAETKQGKHAAMTDEEIAKLAEEFVSDDEAPTATVTKNEDVEKDEQGEAHTAPAKAPASTTVAAANKKTDAHAVPTKAETKTEPKAANTETPKVAATIATDKKVSPPAVDPGKARIPSSLPRNLASSPIGKYTVQVGSYPTEEEATKQTERLKKEGLSAFFVEAKVKAGDTTKTWYRVSVGLFATKKEAEGQMNSMVADKKVPSAIVQQISK